MVHIKFEDSFSKSFAALRSWDFCVFALARADRKLGGVCVAVISICFCKSIRCCCMIINWVNKLFIFSVSIGLLKPIATLSIICPVLDMLISNSTWCEIIIQEVIHGFLLFWRRSLSSSVKSHSIAVVAHCIISNSFRSLYSLLICLICVNAKIARPNVPIAVPPANIKNKRVVTLSKSKSISELYHRKRLDKLIKLICSMINYTVSHTVTHGLLE